jgi:type II secretory pathway pseudopilin PulG
MLPSFSDLLAQTAPSPTDPLTLFFQLGISGAVALVFFFWQRDTAKQRDKAIEQLSQFTIALQEMRESVNRSTAAHEAAATAMSQMTGVLRERPPTRLLINRLTDAVETIEQMSKKG